VHGMNLVGLSTTSTFKRFKVSKVIANSLEIRHI
jgi:hypothetical protein